MQFAAGFVPPKRLIIDMLVHLYLRLNTEKEADYTIDVKKNFFLTFFVTFFNVF